MTDEINEPVVGQRFLDQQGVYWLVQSVNRSEMLGDFYIVRLAFGPTRECDHEVWALGAREFQALCRERALAPDA